MNDFNTNPILAAILAALNEHIDARVRAILETQPKPEVSPVVDMDALRELVTPLIDASVTEAVAQAMEAHCEEYNHDGYDEVVNKLDYDLEDFVTKSDLESEMSDAIQEAVGNLTFDITVR